MKMSELEMGKFSQFFSVNQFWQKANFKKQKKGKR